MINTGERLFRTSARWLALGLILATLAPWNDASAESARSDAPDTPDTARPWFKETAEIAGLDFLHDTGQQQEFRIPESVAGGVCLLDFDGDGLLDVYAVQAGPLKSDAADRPRNKLFRNRGGMRFEDVTGSAGVGDTGYGMGCSVGDVDGDGDADLFVANLGANRLYENKGDGTFADISQASGVDHAGFGASSGFFDYDRDGDLDLFVVNYITWSAAHEPRCQPTGERDYCAPGEFPFSPAKDLLYRNRGDGVFEDVSAQAGIHAAFGNGLGLALADFNGDGRPDIYVANDQMANQLWIQTEAGSFEDEALLAGCALNFNGETEAGMGVAIAHLSGGPDVDLFVTHYRMETNTLYRRRGDYYEDATARAGLGATSLPYTGFGVGFADFDHDGIDDLLVVNGRVNRNLPVYDSADPYAEPNQLFRGMGAGRFRDQLPQGGTLPRLIGAGRAAAFGDLDNDGDVDVVVINKDGPLRLLENTAAQAHWLMLELHDAAGRHAIGARASLEGPRGVMTKSVTRVGSYLASNDPRLHFGLGSQAKVPLVTVTWPSGARERFGPLAIGQLHELRQGQGRSNSAGSEVQ